VRRRWWWGSSRPASAGHLSEPGLRRAIALFALAFAGVQIAVMLRGRTLFRERPHWKGGALAGLYLLGLGLSGAGVVATGNALYAVTNLLKTATYWQIGFLTAPVLLAAALATPFLYAGVWLGYRANRLMPRRWFEVALVGLAVAGSLRLLAVS
jgi:hypothetical protein